MEHFEGGGGGSADTVLELVFLLYCLHIKCAVNAVFVKVFYISVSV